ncbi:MAG: hypothetical protein BGO41_09030 [Clostridiales bacterium 38-18]|nr:MAG: hypothetical protein BGO41_09030 [Clostridiales bacterium 38-18]
MSKEILEQLEFEKNKRNILKQVNESKAEQITQKTHSDQKYAWEYELESYRRSKRKERFYTFGAICGILALVISMISNFDTWIRFLMQF